MQYVIGIDPGLKGGIAVIAADTSQLDSSFVETKYAYSCVMPVRKKSGGNKKEIDGKAVRQILVEVSPVDISWVVIEQVHAMPKQGVTSMFTFGEGYGKLLGVIECLGLPYIKVSPQTWKKVVLAGTKKDKNAAIRYARGFYPDIELIPKGCRTAHNGIADAVCLASYGILHLLGQKE